jgi:predicted amidohydrolase
MSVRVAVASTPLTARLEDAVPAAIAAVEEAARLGAALVCLPETALPGHRSQPRRVPDYSEARIDAAIDQVAAAVGRAGLVAIVGAERPTAAGREIVATVIGADGRRLGEQAKTQIDPSEEADYVPGRGRRTFEAAGARFAVAICHEAFRYPEIGRDAALAGAQILFVPHFVVTDDGSRPSGWCEAATPYNEKALLCRALENTVYVAQANNAAADQGSATAIVGPDGSLLALVPYGEAGVAAADLDLSLSDATMARRWAPDRSLIAPA